MLLLTELPAAVLEKIGTNIPGEVEVAGLRGTSVVAREIATLA